MRPNCDFIIVFAHWGIEYKDKETKEQVVLGHELIDAGADLIIGSHPHVIQPIEIYKNKAIFYSLGNFIFDQGFSKATKEGLGVRVVLEKNQITFKLIGLEINKNKLSFPEKETFQSRMNILISELPQDFKEKADIDGQIVIPR